MEKKTLALYIGIVLLGLGIMVGIVLFLRARSLPVDDTLRVQTSQPTRTQGGAAAPIKGVAPFKPYDQFPKEPPYKPGDPGPTQDPLPFIPPEPETATP